MPSFSERNGYLIKPLQIESMSIELRNRLWNIYRSEIYYEEEEEMDSNYIEEIMDACGLIFVNVYDKWDLIKNIDNFHIWFFQAKWYKIYDFIEIYLSHLPTKTKKDVRNVINAVLLAENSAYRVIGEQVVSITNKDEISCIEHAQKTKYDTINIHIQKATKLFSRRPAPDYENSIKESISAIEAMCSIITGITGKSATLGNMIKHLKDKGVYIHPAMENAYSSLYGYTNDEGGIRHGSMDFKDAPAEDAKYMLVSCSAFVNYLMEKWNKVASV